MDQDASIVVGVLAVGFAYSIVATLAALGRFARNRRRRSAALGQDFE
jgi:hypothetical protein